MTGFRYIGSEPAKRPQRPGDTASHIHGAGARAGRRRDGRAASRAGDYGEQPTASLANLLLPAPSEAVRWWWRALNISGSRLALGVTPRRHHQSRWTASRPTTARPNSGVRVRALDPIPLSPPGLAFAFAWMLLPKGADQRMPRSRRPREAPEAHGGGVGRVRLLSGTPPCLR